MSGAKRKQRMTFAFVSLTILYAVVLIYFLALMVIFVSYFKDITVTDAAHIVRAVVVGLIVSFPLAAVWIFHLLLVNARYGDPFNRGTVNRLNLMGSLILVPWLLTSNWWNAVTQWFGPRQEFDLTIPFTQGGTMPINGFVMALLIFGMAEVFRRGVQLREEQELTV